MSTRYARQIALADVGAEGQARLGRARMLIVGLGGLGCPAALYLATSGVGTLVLNDFDRVDESNLPRQILYGPGDVGALKVEAAKARLTALNPRSRSRAAPNGSTSPASTRRSAPSTSCSTAVTILRRASP